LNLCDELNPIVRRNALRIVWRFAIRGNGFLNKDMKQTEIIIETHRVKVVQRRSGSSRTPSAEALLSDLEPIDVSGGGDAADAEISNSEVPEEEKQPCTDSRNR